jgi:hypothetical protein
MIGESWTIAIWHYYTILILKNRKGTIMRNSNFNLIKSLGHVGDSEEEHKLLMMEGYKK